MLRPKRSGRKDATVYVEPYWFDESLSLTELHELHGLPVATADELRRPVGALAITQIDQLLQQGTDPHYLAPIAIARLRGELGTAERALVRQLLELGDFWVTHPYLRAQLEQILQAHLARNPGESELAERTASFLQS